MTHAARERIARVRRLLDVARAIHDDRARLAPEIVATTGLSPEGVALGFESLEREASEADLRALLDDAGTAEHVHVILSANVFVGALRAIALARAAAARVTVQASSRDPVLAREIVERAADPTLVLASDRRLVAGADAIHVYGRAETIAAVRGAAGAGATVRAHGPGLGVAILTAAAEARAAAERLARDVVAFDQRGCLSPRVVLVEGDASRARELGEALAASLSDGERRVPRGALTADERAEAVRWKATMCFAGEVWSGPTHAVAVSDSHAPAAVPPPGRHLQLQAFADWTRLGQRLATLAPWVVAVGSDDPDRAAEIAPAHARRSALGRMQLPPLDGAVDRRRG